MMKDLRIENLNDFEVVSELIIGVSYLTGKKISSLFNINDINNYIFCSDYLLNKGYDYFIRDYFESNNLKEKFTKEEIDKSYNVILRKVESIFKEIRNILKLVKYITIEQFLYIVESYN